MFPRQQDDRDPSRVAWQAASPPSPYHLGGGTPDTERERTLRRRAELPPDHLGRNDRRATAKLIAITARPSDIVLYYNQQHVVA